MSHKDAPPETPSQTACREFWQRSQPAVTRAWGRAKDGSFLAEESRLLHKAWEAASGEAWKNAVLDALSGTGMDAAPNEPPHSILNRIIRWHMDVATDPALAQQPAAIPRLANCGRYTATDNTGQHYYLNHANTWQTFQGQQPAAPSADPWQVHLADALDCFWNAACEGAGPDRSNVIGGMAEGFAAMAARLREHAAPQQPAGVDEAMVERMAQAVATELYGEPPPPGSNSLTRAMMFPSIKRALTAAQQQGDHADG